MQPKKNVLIILIVLDIIWSLAALIFDFSRIAQIPPLLWPFIIICPIFPMLLAIYWIQSLSGKDNKFLRSFVSLPGFIYLIAAVIYYPAWMIINGFDILSFGQIFWVMVYGLQCYYLLAKKRTEFAPSVIAVLYLWSSFLVQYLFRSLGFYDMTNFKPELILGGYTVLIFCTIIVEIKIIRQKEL